MTYILTNAKETCRYEEANNKFLLGGATSGSQSIRSALAQSSGTASVDQFPCEVTVRYIDQAFSSRYEVIRGVYNSSDNSITRVSTVSSTTGTSSISFDASQGPDNLVIYGTTSHQAFGVRTLQEGLLTPTSLSINTIGSDQRLTNTVSITPSSPQSRLILDFSTVAYFSASAAVSSQRGRLRPAYVNSSGVDTPAGTNVFVGFANRTVANATSTIYVPWSQPVELNQSHLNGSNDWELLILGRLDFTDQVLEAASGASRVYYRELL